MFVFHLFLLSKYLLFFHVCVRTVLTINSVLRRHPYTVGTTSYRPRDTLLRVF